MAGDLAEAMRDLWLPVLIGAVFLVGTFMLWRHLVGREEAMGGAMMESETGRVREEVERALDARANGIDALARGLAEEGETRWPALAERLVDSDLRFRAVARLDTSMAVRDARPDGATLLPWLAPADSGVRAVAIRVALDAGHSGAAAAETAPLGSGEQEIVVCARVPAAAGATTIVGVMRQRDLLDDATRAAVRRGFQVAVFDGAERVYGAEESGIGLEFARDTAAHRDAVLWRIVVWPSDDLTGSLETHASQWVLGLGMLLACAASLAAFTWRRAAELERNAEP